MMRGTDENDGPGLVRLSVDEASGLGRYVPIVHWLPRYQRSWLRADTIAGLTLWGLVVPEGIAYAGIAGLPPQAGLYTLVASLLFLRAAGDRTPPVGPGHVGGGGAPRHLRRGGVAAAGPRPIPKHTRPTRGFVLVTGAVFLAAGLARLGFITQFLSKPVMDGFVVGRAIFVTVGQLSKRFGVEKPEGNTIEKLVGTVRELPQGSLTTFAVGAAALALLFLLPRLSRKIPAGLVVLFGAIALSAALDLEGAHGVAVVGTLPQGLPTPSLPDVPLSALAGMAVTAIGVLLVAYSEALGVAHEFAEKHGYEVDADQELNAHGVVNLVSGLLGGMLAGGSMSASAVKEGAGARTQVANLIAWGVTIVTLLLLTPLFAPLPEAVLAALIIHALWHLVASRKLVKLRRAAPVEVWFGVITLWGVLLFDVLEGMIIGLLASLLFVVYRSSRARLSSLGRVPGVPGAYSDAARHPDDTPVPGVLIVRLDAPVYYANALTVRDAVRSMTAAQEPPPRAVVLDTGTQDELDVTSTEMIKGLVKQLREGGLQVYFADVHAPILDRGRQTGLLEAIGEDHVFPTVDAAVRHIEAVTGDPRI
jgi:high affinity sulfate transporter 1